MNNSTSTLYLEDDLELLETVNDEELEYLLPTIVFLFAVSLFGIPGNIFTLIFYRKGCLKSNYKFFILTVASIDLLSCCVAIPLENFLLLSGYSQDDRHVLVCKLSRFSNIFMSYSSGFVLSLIAVERYRKVCRPFNTQFSPAIARKLCVGAIIAGILISWPSLLVWGKKTLKIVVDEREVTVIDCAVSDKAISSKAGFVYPVIMFVLAVVLITLDAVLYSLIGCKINRESNRVSKKSRISSTFRGGNTSITSCGSCENDKEIDRSEGVSEDIIKVNIEESCVESKTNSTSHKGGSPESNSNEMRTHLQMDTETTDSGKHSENFMSCKNNCRMRGSRKILNRARASKTSRVMFIISAIYVVTYIPNLTIVTISSVVNGFYSDQTPAELAVSNFFVRLYFLNCCANPFVYALCDSGLRSAVSGFFVSLKARLSK